MHSNYQEAADFSWMKRTSNNQTCSFFFCTAWNLIGWGRHWKQGTGKKVQSPGWVRTLVSQIWGLQAHPAASASWCGSPEGCRAPGPCGSRGSGVDGGSQGQSCRVEGNRASTRIDHLALGSPLALKPSSSTHRYIPYFHTKNTCAWCS